MASESKTSANITDPSEQTDFKLKYKTLKRKLKGLVYENELLTEQLERAQKKLLRVSRDRSFLLDRMLQYEKVADSSSDSDATDVSESDTDKPTKKKSSTPTQSQLSSQNPAPNKSTEETTPDLTTKKGSKSKSNKKLTKTSATSTKRTPPMSIEDIEKHLDSRPSVPSIEKATTSMPADIFSNVDSEGTSDNEADAGLVIDVK